MRLLNASTGAIGAPHKVVFSPSICSLPRQRLGIILLRHPGICHACCRDLKSGNLLVADSGHVLLADFGACAILEREAAAPGLATALEDPSSHACSPHMGGAHRSQRWKPRRTGLSCDDSC